MGRSVTPNTGNEIQPVASAVGFLSGDLVYETTSGISRIPDNAVATATFPVNAVVPDYRYTSASAGNLKYVENVGGGQFAPSAARLTNGNIVVAYGIRNTVTSTNNDVYFKIVDVNDTVVVAQTAVATVAGGVYMNFGSAGVLALPNGGFVVVFHSFNGTTRRISYRVYNASGVAQTALITDTSIVTSGGYYQVAFAARSDSSFVVAFADVSNGPTYRVYSAAGTTVYSGAFGAAFTSINGNRQLSVVVRSDDSYVLTSVDGGNSSFRYAIFSSTNTSLGASTISVVGGGAAQHIDSVLLASDVVGIAVYSSSGFIEYRSITGTTVSAQSTLISGFSSISFSGFALDSFSSGSRFIVTYSFFSSSVTGSAYNNSYKMSYAVFNSSGTLVTATQTLKGITVYTSNQVPAFVEVGSTLRIYMSPISTYNSLAPTFSPKGIYYAVINTATSATVPQQSFNLTSGTTAAQPVSGYARVSSTPSSAQFFASSTSSIVATISQSTSAASTQVLGKTFLDNFSVSSIASCYLGNGTYAVAYIAASTTTVRVVILNSSGTILNTITPGTGSAGFAGSIRICCLGNGRIVVAWRSDATSISYRVYSPAYALLLSGIITGTASSSTGRFGLSPLGSSSLANNYFIISYINNTPRPVYEIYADNSTTAVATGIVDNSGNSWETADVVGLRSGDFYFGGYASSYGTYRIAYYANSLAGNTWSFAFAGNAVNSSSSVSYTGLNMMLTQDDIAVFGYGDGGSNTYFVQMASGSNANFPTYSGTGVDPSGGTDSRTGISCTGEGDMFYTNGQVVSGGATGATFPMPYGYSTSINTLSRFFPIPNTGGVSLVSCSPSFNNSALYATIDAATGFPVAAVIYPISGSTVTNLTAGVSTSSSIPLTLTRYVLKGIAVTTCSAGGSGLIQTSGVAQLNTQYSSLPSQPFDFTNQIIKGVRGILSGRTVTIEG